MSDDLLQRIRCLQANFLAAVGQGADAVVAFNADYTALLKEVKHALVSGSLPPDVGEIAHTAFAALASQATILLDYDTGAAKLVRTELESEGDVDESAGSPSIPAASAPLFRYFLANVTFPYPEQEEKERIAEEVRSLGWRDFDKKKFEDWLNRKRHQSGFLAVMRRYCGEDREGMRSLCRKALYGSAAEKASLPDGALEDIEDICDFLQSQYEDLAADCNTTWVDELTIGVEALFSHHPSQGLFSVDDTFDSSDPESDSDCDLSDTDVEDEDDDEDEDPPRVLIGAKRKLAACSEILHHPISRPLSRSPSIASSTSSSSTACSLRSFSGTSMSSLTDVGGDDDSEIYDRPSKRSRSESCSPRLEQSFVQTASLPAATATNPLFTSYRTKRKRTDDDPVTRMRSIKRSRYAALGVASHAIGISDSHLSALSCLCSIKWTLVDSAVSDFNVDAYTIDCTQPGYSVKLEDIAVFNSEVDELAEDTLTWSKLQVYTIFRMLLPAGVRPLPPALAQTMTLSFDVNALSHHDVTSLSQLFALTPEDIAAMYNSMNAASPPLETPEILMPVAEDATSPTSSSSSEGSSPPALSDDSGSSTRSSSVEPSSEQDSLLTSPAELSADYSQLCNELFSWKTLNVDPWRLKVEHGAMPDVAIGADELSGAADLLSRYLLDSITAA